MAIRQEQSINSSFKPDHQGFDHRITSTQLSSAYSPTNYFDLLSKPHHNVTQPWRGSGVKDRNDPTLGNRGVITFLFFPHNSLSSSILVRISTSLDRPEINFLCFRGSY